MIDLYCPSCGHHLCIQEKFAGKSGACKHCGVVFTVPEKGDIPTSTRVEVSKVQDEVQSDGVFPEASRPKETVYQTDMPESAQHEGRAKGLLQSTEFMPD